MLGQPEGRVVNISGASDGRFFSPTDPMPETSRRILHELGITRPFVLNAGGLDERKNSWRLLDAFAQLPERLRRDVQFVMTSFIMPSCRAEVVGDAELLVNASDTGDIAAKIAQVLEQPALAATPKERAVSQPDSSPGSG